MVQGKKLTNAELLRAFRIMLTSRTLDEKMLNLLRQGRSFFHIGAAGHEAAQIGAALALRPGYDWAFPYYRDQAFVLTWGVTPAEILMNFLARRDDPSSGGRQLPQHYGHDAYRIVSQSSPTGTQFLQAVGVALGGKKLRKDEVVYVSSGEGTASQGDFYEAINWATRDRLPVIFLIEDNNYAISVPRSQQAAGTTVYEMVMGYSSLHRHEINGLEVRETFRTIQHCAARARAGEGPSLVVAHTIRLLSHSSSDDQRKYRKQSDLQKDAESDPLISLERLLISKGIASPAQIRQIKEQVDAAVEQAVNEAESSPSPDADTVNEHLFSPRIMDCEIPEPLAQSGKPIVLVDALNHALKEEMEANERILVFGEDVADDKGGVFTVTKGLSTKFGLERVFNSPLAESSIIGTAIGLAIQGWKPVVEIQFGDYIWTAMMQIRNEVATMRWRSVGRFACPMVIRVPVGGYIHGGLCHSQNIEGFFAHLPGINICYPSNAADAKGLLKQAIRGDDPVLFLEHKGLYRQSYAMSDEPGAAYRLPFGRARVVRPGDQATVVTWGMMVHKAMIVAQKLAQTGDQVEIVDLRTIQPLDRETVLESVRKTGRVLILHEDSLTAGFGAEVAAIIGAEAFESLDAPIQRLAALDTPIPYNWDLETRVLPGEADIEAALKNLLMY